MTETTPPPPAVWPCLVFDDAESTARFLVDAFGFRLTALHHGEGEQVGHVVHGELRWPPGGGVMFGSSGRDDSEFSAKPAGAASVYLVTDEPDALFERATAAGADIVRGLVDEDYGSRGFTARDPEGNLWSFGTYRGEP